jgi:hypothetical protein
MNSVLVHHGMLRWPSSFATCSRPRGPAVLLTRIAVNGATAFMVILAMTFGLIMPRMLLERVLPARS